MSRRDEPLPEDDCDLPLIPASTIPAAVISWCRSNPEAAKGLADGTIVAVSAKTKHLCLDCGAIVFVAKAGGQSPAETLASLVAVLGKKRA